MYKGLRADDAAMSFLFPQQGDGRLPRDEDQASARGSQNRLSRSNTVDGTAAPAELQLQNGAADSTAAATVQRRRVVFPDPVAFRYLENDPCVKVIERRSVLRGYELYLVEQWACSRQSPTLVVVTFTGHQKHSVVVGVLSIPADDTLWSEKLHFYFKATRQYHARPKETDLGELMVTNLNSFPSALTVISVPDGDIKQHRQDFFVNEDLKRLGCSGRSGLTLTDPTEPTQAKFQQLYRTSDRIPFKQSVTELIKLCQVALYMFEKLDHEYVDGLLCDVTERAIGNWWTEVGAEHYNFEPTDGMLGPSTVAALLGMLLGARNRLQWSGAPVSKDVFDIDTTKRGVASFQRAQKLEKTRRLDRQTLFKLHTATAKAAAGEGWGVQKAVKSTMTEIGGKRGELVMGMVSGKDKGGLSDIETLDIDKFVSLVYGERPKWLWHGKPRRATAEHLGYDHDRGTSSFTRDGPLTQTARRIQTLPAPDEDESRRKEDSPGPDLTLTTSLTASVLENSADRDALRKTMFRSVAGKMSDARGRIKDAVGGTRRGHATRASMSAKEDLIDSGAAQTGLSTTTTNSSAIGASPEALGRVFTWKNKPEEYLEGMRRTEFESALNLPKEMRETSVVTTDFGDKERPEDDLNVKNGDLSADRMGSEEPQETRSRAISVVPSIADESDLQGPPVDSDPKPDPRQLVFSRRHSFGTVEGILKRLPNENRWPRRMSFSDAEEAIFALGDVIDIVDAVGELQGVEALPEIACHLHESIQAITYQIEPWVDDKLKTIERLNKQYGRDQDELQHIYHQLREAYSIVRSNSDELLAEERAQLTEGVKEIEVLAQRLDYEIGGLVQRVNDLEDGVANFERQVDDVEKRAEELKVQLETESWLHWFVRTLTGVGTGPNITRVK